MELSVQTKTYLVLGIMVCCFAVLYPKIFHPMLLAGLGMRQSAAAQGSAAAAADWQDGVHPKLRRPPQMSGGGGGGPGPRMAAEHAAAQQQRQHGGGGGRGNVVGLILPVYAIGIVLYLVYTLVKVMGGFKASSSAAGRGDSAARGGAASDYYKNFHFDPLSGEFVDNGGGGGSGGGGGGGGRRGLDADDDCGSLPAAEQTRYERMHRDLEKLLKRVDDQDISENELTQLRSRLEETEKQMTNILGAMQSLQQRQSAAAAAAAAPAAEAAADTETRQRKAFSLQDAE